MEQASHRNRSGAPLWTVAPGKQLESATGTMLGAGDEVLLSDMPDPSGKLSTRERMALLVQLGTVLRSEAVEHRHACVEHAQAAQVRFVVADQSIPTIAHMDGKTPCAQGIAAKGQRVLPSDVHDGLSGLLELEARGLLVRESTTRNRA